MSDKLVIDIWKKKDPDEITQELARPESRLEIGSAAAMTAASAAAFAERAANCCNKSERIAYIVRNTEIIRSYMVHLIDEDIKCRGPLRQALKEGEAYKIDASRQPAICIAAEIINMMGTLLNFISELADVCPGENIHWLGEAAHLAMGASESCRIYIVNMADQSSDDTYRFVTRRENELTLNELKSVFGDIMKKTSI